MKNHSIHPIQILKSLWHNRELIQASTKREVLGRYKGPVLGLLWSFANPLFMLSVYTFVFSIIFKARWGQTSDSKAEFALILFAGLMVFNLFSECIGRAPGLILGNTNYVKKVIYPLEILTFINFFSALYHFLISLVVWFTAYLLLSGSLHWTVLYLPIVLLPLSLMTLGLSWFLSSLGVFLRDVTQVISLVLTVLMFLSPIFYPISAIPEKYQKFMYLNPLVFIIEMVRDILYWGHSPNFLTLIVLILFSILVAWFGFIWFQKTRKGFADVL